MSYLKIGVPACFLYPDPERKYFGAKSLCYIENEMTHYLAKHSAMPILIPDLKEVELYRFLDQMDGFLFQGGVDMAPSSYGDELICNGQWPGDSYRDLFEFKILDHVFDKKKPVFGICRGFQVINAYLGGKLYQDIATELDTETIHRSAEIYDKNHHRINLIKNGYLSSLYEGQESAEVNSVHHQAVKNLAESLVPEAYSANDDIIEAFVSKNMDKHYILGVQWHPEFSATLDKLVLDPSLLMEDFLKNCS